MMCWGIVRHVCPVFSCPHFGIPQTNCLPQIGKHVLVPLTVDCSTLRNKPIVHNGLEIKKILPSPPLLSNPARTLRHSVMMESFMWRTVIYFGDVFFFSPGPIFHGESVSLFTVLMSSSLILMQSSHCSVSNLGTLDW